MIIILDRSLTEIRWVDDPESVDAVDNILRTHREGKHLAFASRDVAVRLRSELSSLLNPRSLAVLQEFAVTAATRGDPLSGLNFGILVFYKSSASSSSPRLICVPLSKFRDSIAVQKSVLLAENLVDARLYENLAQATLFFIGRRGEIRAEPAGGGGSTIAQEFTRYVGESRPCVAIADSDRASPTSAVGDTAKGLISAAESRSPLQDADVIPSRAAENLLPVELIRNSVDEQKYAAASVIEQIAASNPQLLRYANLRDGTRAASILRAGAAGEEPWASLLQGSRCEDGGSDHREGCSCYLTPELGSFLHKAVRILEKKSRQKKAEALGLSASEELGDLGRKIASWCIGKRPSLV